MGNVIEKGNTVEPTGFDLIANTIDTYGQSTVPMRTDLHHEPNDVVSAITNFQTKLVSATVKIQKSDYDANDNPIPARMIAGNVTIPLFKEDSDGNYTISALEGDIYVDINGNITTS